MISYARVVLVFVVAFLAGCGGCTKSQITSDDDAAPLTAASSSAATAKPATPKDALTITVVYGSEKKTWFEEQAKAFAATGAKSSSGRAIRIEPKAMGSGEAIKAITEGTVKAHVYSPASAVYLSMLNTTWLMTAGRTKPIATKSEPLVLSPVVIAMWKPMAEALGWPKKQLSWSDLLKVNTNPKGWGAVGFPEWGRFKLGHCHPEFSNSGFLSVLAEAYAGSKKTRDLTEADLDAKSTREFVTRVEETIVHYGKSTGFFADKMAERGPSYLSAAVLYENLVIESYAKTPAPSPPIVAIYPLEGTFWSDHPYSILDVDWVGDEERQAADQFLTFLKARPAQERAMALGFRPSDPSIAVGAPVDAEHGVDARQPQTVLPIPGSKVLTKLLALWETTKKGADVVFLFDKSGSMRGKPLEEAKTGAHSFLSALSDRDQVTLVFFDSTVYPAVGPLTLATGRDSLNARIDAVAAEGGTSLYDAVSAAYESAAKRAEANPARIHAIVVMTDGSDENSKMTLENLVTKFPSEGEAPVKVFAIAYGDQAEGKALARIAEAAKGTSTKGSVETIRDVYLDMASFF